MDIRAMNVARSYDTARSATEPQPGTGTGAALTHAIGDFATTFREGEATARAAMIRTRWSRRWRRRNWPWRPS